MSAKKAKLNRLLADRNKLVGKIIGLKIYCQNNPNDLNALNRIKTFIDVARKELNCG